MHQSYSSLCASMAALTLDYISHIALPSNLLLASQFRIHSHLTHTIIHPTVGLSSQIGGWPHPMWQESQSEHQILLLHLQEGLSIMATHWPTKALLRVFHSEVKPLLMRLWIKFHLIVVNKPPGSMSTWCWWLAFSSCRNPSSVFASCNN